MALPPRQLNAQNIDAALNSYRRSIDEIGHTVGTARGVELLRLLKRGQAGSGPYPTVSLFEAANRIMTDLVILNGVRWLLAESSLPFREYTVEYGHEDNGDHDIVATDGDRRLIGEAFNVAASFFPIKKSSALRKLRASTAVADYRLVVCNCEAVTASYGPKPQTGEYFLFVDIDSGHTRVVPNIRLQPTVAGAMMSHRG